MKSNSTYIVFTDGGARGNPGYAAYGFVVKDSNGITIYREGKTIGIATNNTAEYTGVISALQWIKNNLHEKNTSIQFYLDSELVSYQLEGKYRIKNENLRNLYFTVKQLESECNCTTSYTPIPRENNSEADKLVNDALDAQ